MMDKQIILLYKSKRRADFLTKLSCLFIIFTTFANLGFFIWQATSQSYRASDMFWQRARYIFFPSLLLVIFISGILCYKLRPFLSKIYIFCLFAVYCGFLSYNNFCYIGLIKDNGFIYLVSYLPLAIVAAFFNSIAFCISTMIPRNKWKYEPMWGILLMTYTTILSTFSFPFFLATASVYDYVLVIKTLILIGIMIVGNIYFCLDCYFIVTKRSNVLHQDDYFLAFF